jgi:hypothetical protein
VPLHAIKQILRSTQDDNSGWNRKKVAWVGADFCVDYAQA